MENTKDAKYHEIKFSNGETYYISDNNSVNKDIVELEHKTNSKVSEKKEVTLKISGKTLNENNQKYLHVMTGVYKLNEWWGRNSWTHTLGNHLDTTHNLKNLIVNIHAQEDNPVPNPQEALKMCGHTVESINQYMDSVGKNNIKLVYDKESPKFIMRIKRKLNKESIDNFNMVDYASKLVSDIGKAQTGNMQKQPSKINKLLDRINSKIQQTQVMIDESEAPLDMRMSYQHSLDVMKEIKSWIAELYNIVESIKKEGWLNDQTPPKVHIIDRILSELGKKALEQRKLYSSPSGKHPYSGSSEGQIRAEAIEWCRNLIKSLVVEYGRD